MRRLTIEGKTSRATSSSYTHILGAKMLLYPHMPHIHTMGCVISTMFPILPLFLPQGGWSSHPHHQFAYVCVRQLRKKTFNFRFNRRCLFVAHFLDERISRLWGMESWYTRATHRSISITSEFRTLFATYLFTHPKHSITNYNFLRVEKNFRKLSADKKSIRAVTRCVAMCDFSVTIFRIASSLSSRKRILYALRWSRRRKRQSCLFRQMWLIWQHEIFISYMLCPPASRRTQNRQPVDVRMKRWLVVFRMIGWDRIGQWSFLSIDAIDSRMLTWNQAFAGVSLRTHHTCWDVELNFWDKHSPSPETRHRYHHKTTADESNVTQYHVKPWECQSNGKCTSRTSIRRRNGVTVPMVLSRVRCTCVCSFKTICCRK